MGFPRETLTAGERVIFCEGVMRHHMEDIPLARVSGMSSARTLLDRLIGSGKLTIVSGDNHTLVLDNVSGIVRLQRDIHAWLEISRGKAPDNGTDL